MNALSHPKYRPDIDGLRAIAVLAVVAFHAFPELMKGGFIGVDVFFVISGYLISTIIFESLDKSNFSFSEFYVRRIKRIFPALIIVLLTCFAFGWFVLLSDEYRLLGKHIAAGAGFVSNLVLWNEAGYFDNSAETKPLLHLWSLAIEEQFYLVWPFVLWLGWKCKFNLLSLTFFITIFSFALNVYGIKQDSIATFYSPLTRFWELLAGSLLAWFSLYKQSAYESLGLKIDGWHGKSVYRDNSEIDGRVISNILSFIGILLLIYGFWRIDKNFSFPGMWALVPVSGTVLIILSGSKAWINRILANKLVVWFGLISFPLYLWHWPLLSFARIVEGEDPSVKVRIGVVVFSVVLSWLTYKFIEIPIRFGKRANLKAILLALLMVIVCYAGYITHNRDGLKFRSAAKSTKQDRENLRTKEDELRNIEIRSGICQFNTKGKFKEIDAFVANWNCFSDDEGLLNSRTLVFGDSHSADMAMGLRLNGVDVVQLGGGGCPINPKLATDQRSDCLELFGLLKRFDDKYDFIILSENFSRSEITNENLLEIFNYWKGEKQVYLFTPIPNFRKQMSEFTKRGKITSSPDFSREDSFLKVVNNIDIPSNFTIVKSSEIWCLNRESGKDYPCLFALNNELLMTDGEHLSVFGSKIFAENMISHPLLKLLFSP